MGPSRSTSTGYMRNPGRAFCSSGVFRFESVAAALGTAKAVNPVPPLQIGVNSVNDGFPPKGKLRIGVMLRGVWRFADIFSLPLAPRPHCGPLKCQRTKRRQ